MMTLSSSHRCCHTSHLLFIIGVVLIVSDVLSVTGFLLSERHGHGHGHGHGCWSRSQREIKKGYDLSKLTSTVTVPVLNLPITALEASRKKKKSKSGGSGGGKNKKVGNVALGFGKAAGKWDGCEPLRKWLIERGADVKGVSVGVVNKDIGLRGVIASKDFGRGDVVFSVPRSKCIIDESRVDSSPLAEALFPDRPDRDALPACVRNALYLIWLERQRNANTVVDTNVEHQYDEWSPLLSALPIQQDFAADGGPMELWDEEEVSWVECGQVIAEIRSRKEDLKEQYQNRILPSWLQANTNPANDHLHLGHPPTLDQLRHSVCVVTSRNFGEGEPNCGTSSMIVPGVDLCNHQDPPVHTLHGLSPEGDFVVYADADIAAGDEIFLTYGPLPNRLLLAQFGFMLPGLPSKPLVSDIALVRIDALFQTQDEEDSTDKIAEAAGSTSPIVTADLEAAAEQRWEAGPGPIALRGAKKEVLRNKVTRTVSRWQPAPLARMVIEHIADPAEGNDGIEVTSRYHALLRREMEAYSTTLEEDEAELLKGSASPRRNWALQFRIQSKRLLQKEIDGLVVSK